MTELRDSKGKLRATWNPEEKTITNVNYNDVSSGGHFGKQWLPWEMDDEDAEHLYGE